MWELYIIYSPSGKVYGGMHAKGKTTSWQYLSPNGHLVYWPVYLGSGNYIRQAIAKYGCEAMRKDVISYANSIEEASKFEKCLIRMLRLGFGDLCKNMTAGGYGGLTGGEFKVGHKVHEKTRNNLRDWCKSEAGRKRLSEVASERVRAGTSPIKGGWNKGIPSSESTKQKIRNYYKNRPHPCCRKVKQIETGIIFNSLTLAARSVSVDSGSITVACQSSHVCKGFHWVYVD